MEWHLITCGDVGCVRKSLTHHHKVHYIGSSPFCSGVRILSETFYFLYNAIIILHNTSWIMVNSGGSLTEQYIPSCFVQRREGTAWPVDKCKYEHSSSSQHKLQRRSLFLHLKMIIQHVFYLKVLMLMLLFWGFPPANIVVVCQNPAIITGAEIMCRIVTESFFFFPFLLSSHYSAQNRTSYIVKSGFVNELVISDTAIP